MLCAVEARGRQRTRKAPAALAMMLGASGCYDGFDPLDPEVLVEIARSHGDAEGTDRSGIYFGTVEVIECGCLDVGAAADVSLCVRLEQVQALGVVTSTEIELVQADGTARLRAEGLGQAVEGADALVPVFYGPLDADGRISVAGIVQADALAVRGQVLGRIDGTLEPEGTSWRLDADYQLRYLVDLVAQPDVLDLDVEGQALSVDCRERLHLDLAWNRPLPVPLDPG